MTWLARPTRRATFLITALALVAVLMQACARFGHHAPPRPQPGQRLAAIPAEFLDLLTTKKALADLATVMPDGSPQVTPVWFDYDGTYIRVNSARGRVKDRNMRRDPRVALSIVDPDNPYRYVMIRGRVIEFTETGAVDHINKLAKKYRGVETYRGRSRDEVRVMYVIEPRRVVGQGS